jgi:signal transduction histidine kinase/streptogramin lyase
LSGNYVTCVYEDRSGTLWIGTDTGGLSKIDPARKAFHHYAVNSSTRTGLTNNVVSGFAEDHSGMLWISTLGGLNRFDRSTEVFAHYGNDFRDPGSLSKNPTGAVLEDREGSLWVAVDRLGLERLDPSRKRFTHYTHDPRNPRSLGSNTVFSLCEDRTGGLWVGYANNVGPLDRLDLHSGTVTHYRVNAQDSNSFWGGWVWAIYEDTQGYIWIGTGGGGLDRFDRETGSFSHYLHEPNNPFSLSAGSVRSIHEDGGGTLWVGTTAGLNKFDRARGTFVHYTVRDGLESDHLGAILHDDNGCLWISTSRGISKFDPRTAVFRNYNQDDGVSIFQWSLQACRTRNGEMYFGGTNGFVRFHPDSIKDNPYVPPIVITAFKKFDNLVPLDSAISEKHSIEMSYKENVFSFELAALNYTSPEKNQYAYKLEGFDNDWTYCRTRRYATYTNLDGGSYVFRVKGSNNDMVWNETGTSVQVIIRPPFWATWWFRIGSFVAVLLSVGGTIRYVEMQKLRRKIDRLERAQAIERERLRISQDMHDEVGATLTEISILSELAKRNTPQGAAVADQVRKISDRSRQVIDDVSDIIWALNPKNDTLESLVSHLRHFAVQYCSMTSMRCQCDIPDSFPEVFVSSDSRRAIFLIVKEALHNAVKHSCATEVVVKIDATGETAEIQVGDNGKGFNPALPSTRGNGLTNMKSRAESLGGTLAIESPGRGGTMIRLRFPLAALRKE